jgi:putative transposase
MSLRNILSRFQSVVHCGVRAIGTTIARWTKPTSHAPMIAAVADLARSKPQLIAENLLLRHQLIALHRTVKRPRFTGVDRALLVLPASRVQGWKAALLIVKPDTLLRWHRAGFRLVWKGKSQTEARTPQIAAETVTLITEMAANNRLWGAERIRGELLKLNITVAKRTIQRYMRQAQAPRPSGQTWASFLRNHATDIWACDFMHITDLFFRPLFASSSSNSARGGLCTSG